MIPASAEVIETLTGAADHLTAHGWHQGGFYKGWTDTLDAATGPSVGELIREHEMPCCIEGAIWAAAPTETAAQVALDRVRDHLTHVGADAAPFGQVSAADWNDQPARTAADVVDVLHATAREVTA